MAMGRNGICTQRKPKKNTFFVHQRHPLHQGMYHYGLQKLLQNPIDLIPKPPDHEMGPTGHESNKIGYF
jgi:hypothetical protein